MPGLVPCSGVSYFAKASTPGPPPPPSPPPPSKSIPATVPGDILTDLQRANVTLDPYHDSTWQDPAYIKEWSSGTWTYTKSFATPATHANASFLLVFDGTWKTAPPRPMCVRTIGACHLWCLVAA